MRPIEILLVEDNPGDVRLIQEAFRDVRLANVLHVARDGMEALHFLRREGEFLESPSIDLVLLDLDLPRKDGRGVLAEMKADQSLCAIPVAIFHSLFETAGSRDAWQGQVAGFLTKPLDFEQILELVRSLGEFGLAVVHLNGKAKSPL